MQYTSGKGTRSHALFLSYHPRQIRGSESCVKAAYTGTGLSEDGIFRSNGQVANHVKHMATTDSKSVYGGNHRFRDTANLFLYVQYAQTGIPSLPMYPPRPFTFWSPPEQNALSPAPVITITSMSASSRQIRSASLISAVVVGGKRSDNVHG